MRVKKVGVLKEGVPNLVGAGIEGSGSQESLLLGLGIGGHMACKLDYATHTRALRRRQ